MVGHTLVARLVVVKHMIQDGGGCYPRLHFRRGVVIIVVKVRESIHHTHLLTVPGEFPCGVCGIQHDLHSFNILIGVRFMCCRIYGKTAVDGDVGVVHF